MLDIELIRQQPDWVKEQLAKLFEENTDEQIDTILELDRKRRALRNKTEELQSHRKTLNKANGGLRGNKSLDDTAKAAIAQQAAIAINNGDFATATELLQGNQDAGSPDTQSLSEAFESLTSALRELGNHIDRGFQEIREVEATLQENMLWVHNLPHESVPVYENEEENVPWQPEGTFREFDFEPLPHWELGVNLGVIDFERGVKIAGSRFYVLRDWGARLQRALITFFLDCAREKGFEEVYVPYLVHEPMLYGAGQFPKFRDVVYQDQDEGFYLLPTAEVAITNMHRDEILNEADLPLYYVAHTPCFRSEKSSAGRDVRGIKRVHQFEKVEMYKFTTPETSYEELETLTEAASDVCRRLEIPFRKLEIVTGDLGFTATKKYDIEMWAPGSQEWLEVSSCSNTEAFQARRAMIRFRRENQKRNEYVHTLNGSGLATPRVMIAILENYQQADGSVVIPEVLRPYLGGAALIQ